jgi:hypothetical protein
VRGRHEAINEGWIPNDRDRFLTGPVTYFSVSAAVIAWDNFHQLKDTPETKSAFFKNYNPKHVIEPFLCNTGEGAGDGAGADTKSVTHSADFFWAFSMSSDRRLSLLPALNDDVSAHLVWNGAQIPSHSGDINTGFQCSYKVGKNIGTVTIPPVRITPETRAKPLPDGMVDVTAKVDIAEQRFPRKRPQPKPSTPDRNDRQAITDVLRNQSGLPEPASRLTSRLSMIG